MEYEELRFGCGGHVYLRDSLGPNMEVHITSPNHPATPPPHSECIWIIMAPAGKEVQFGRKLNTRINLKILPKNNPMKIVTLKLYFNLTYFPFQISLTVST